MQATIGNPGRLRLIIGHFDPVYAVHVRRLRELADGSCTVMVLTDPANPLSPQRARAEVLAGLSAVDYVVLTTRISAEEIIRAFPGASIVREEGADQERTRKLIDHVHARQAAK